jgi:hypothetical protein
MTTEVSKFPEYAKLLEVVIVNLRMRIRYGEEISIREIHDLMDAIHNIPQMLRMADGWHVPSNIDFDLHRYDEKWPKQPESSRIGLVETVERIRRGEYDAAKDEVDL